MKRLIITYSIAGLLLAGFLDAGSLFDDFRSENPARGWTDASGDSTSWLFAADYRRLYLSFSDALMDGCLVVQRETPHFGLGFRAVHFNSAGYYRTDIGIPLKLRLRSWGLDIGLMPGLARDGFNKVEGSVDPLLDNVEVSPFVDGGLSFSKGIFDLGVSATGIVPVKLGGETAVSEGQDFAVDIGLSPRWFGGRLGVEAEYSPDNPEGEESIWGLSIEKTLGNGMRIGAMGDNRSLDFSGKFRIPGLDHFYGMAGYTYPLNDLATGNGTVSFGLSYTYFPPLQLPDLAIFCALDPGPHRVTDTVLATVTVVNQGDASSGNFVFIAGQDDRIELNLREGAEYTLELPIPAGEPGQHTLTGSVDPMSMVAEQDEGNNITSCTFRTAPVPTCDISVDRSTLSLRSIKYTYQDEALVPMVFFDRNSTDVDKRFDRVLSIFAERLVENQVVTLHLTGFLADDETSDVLDIKRAMAVRDRFLEIEPELRDRIVIETLPDSMKQAMQGIVRNTPDSRRVQDEKRRVLLQTSMDDISVRLPQEGAPSHFIQNHGIALMLRDNPDVSLVVWGDDAGSSMERAIARAGDMADRISAVIGNEDRIFPTYARMEGESNLIEIFLSAEGVLYRPRVVHASRDYTPGKNSDCDINLDYAGTSLSEWRVELSEEDRPYWRIAEGNDKIPDHVEWDFRDSEGNIMPIDREFSMRLRTEDILGQQAEATASANISTIVEENQTRTEKLLVVQFQFNRPEAASRYLDDRLASIARRIISTVEDFDSTRILIEGHSDDIGSARRNIELSSERAEAVYARIVHVMGILLGDEAPVDFLVRNNAVMEASGFGAGSPYVVTEWESGSPHDRLSGDNSLPEGRTINRRVMITITGWK